LCQLKFQSFCGAVLEAVIFELEWKDVEEKQGEKRKRGEEELRVQMAVN
jgi:hypothetical protein